MSKTNKPAADSVVGSATISEPPPPPPPPPSKEAPKDVGGAKKTGKRQVDDLCRSEGNFLELANLTIPVRRPNAAHAAADVLHGWSEHLARTGERLAMTVENYRAALAAAARPAPGERACKPHAPALAPHRAEALKAAKEAR